MSWLFYRLFEIDNYFQKSDDIFDHVTIVLTLKILRKTTLGAKFKISSLLFNLPNNKLYFNRIRRVRLPSLFILPSRYPPFSYLSFFPPTIEGTGNKKTFLPMILSRLQQWLQLVDLL